MNFSTLHQQIKKATVAYFQQAIQRYGDEVCAFALSTDDGVMTLVPAFNTLEHLNACQQKEPQYTTDFIFNPDEWLTINLTADQQFDSICNTLYKSVMEVNDTHFSNFKNTFILTCIQVLKELKSEKFFKKTANQNEIMVLFSISDTAASVDKQIGWFNQLNKEEELINQYSNWLLESEN